jgi:hypothetical protein
MIFLCLNPIINNFGFKIMPMKISEYDSDTSTCSDSDTSEFEVSDIDLEESDIPPSHHPSSHQSQERE